MKKIKSVIAMCLAVTTSVGCSISAICASASTEEDVLAPYRELLKNLTYNMGQSTN